MSGQSPVHQPTPLQASLSEWISQKLEAGTLLTLLAGAVIYTGNVYYHEYFGFFHIYGDDIKPTFFAYFAKSFVVAILSLCVLVIIAHSGRAEALRFGGALIGNVPCIIIAFFATLVLVDIYRLNVQSHSAALMSLQSLGAPPMGAERVQRRTEVVESYVRWVLLIAPPVASLTLAFWLSARRISFSRFVVCTKASARTCIVVLYILLVLRVVGIWGRTAAFMDYVGVFGKQEAAISFLDDPPADVPERLYLIGIGESGVYVTGGPNAHDADGPRRTWLIPSGSVKSMELKAKTPTTGAAMEIVWQLYSR